MRSMFDSELLDECIEAAHMNERYYKLRRRLKLEGAEDIYSVDELNDKLANAKLLSRKLEGMRHE